MNMNFVRRVLEVTGNNDLCSSLYWRTDGEFAPVSFFINCNDFFCWGCADSEDLTEDNIQLLEDTCNELRAINPSWVYLYADDLFCARSRKMRPQGCCYPTDRAVWPLFDACGPEREVGLGNPYPPGGRVCSAYKE